MSFGFKKRVPKIEAAIEYARQHHVLVIAAAGNSGGREEVMFPARYRDTLCVHAVDGAGNSYHGNATQREGSLNFATLGVAVQCQRRAEECSTSSTTVIRSGTSSAAAVAASIAAMLIQIFEHSELLELRRGKKQRYLQQLRSISGMELVFKGISVNRENRYNVIEPWRILPREMRETSLRETVAWKIVELLHDEVDESEEEEIDG